MTMWAEGVLVNRVRIISGSPDELAARVRADRVLNMAGRQPAGLPPAAILCIRTITDPRPRSVVLHHEEVPRPEWTQAVSSSIADKARRAASPACGAVPADAEAVLFADKAELLACLASDWCQGRLREHWWWRALIRDGDHARRVVDAWLAAPMYVAAALEQLTRLQWGPVFVAALHETDTTALTRAVLRGRGLPEPCLASSQLLPRVARPAEPQVPSGAAATSSSDGTEPWLPWAPEAGGTRLRVDQKRLLGLALTVRRAPARMLTAAFVETVFSWTPAGDVVGRQRSPVPHEDGQPLADCPDRHAIASSSTADPIEAVSEVRIIAPEIARVPEDPTAAVPEARFGAQPNTSWADTSPPGDSDRPSIPAWNLPAAGSRDPAADRVFLGSRPTAAVQTACGGVFFLLNLGIRLGLYGDFTMPAAPGIPLPIWDFVTLLGLRLAGPRASGDAVWPLLAELSNRSPDDTPGAHFDPPRSWRVPAEWLQPFSPRGTWHWHVAAGRLRVRHPFGFLVLDVARSFEEDDERQTTRELAEYGDAARIRLRPLRRGRSARRSCSPLEQWMAWLLTYVRRRLAVAMPGLTARTAGPLLCRQPGAVFVTPAHVHVALSLESLPIEVRLSGLDRDPGWIPAAGRHVTFAFE
jgi:hypothetical protein